MISATRLASSVDEASIAGRWGGEEFVVLVPAGDASTAIATAEVIRHDLAVALRSGTVPAFTVSVGLADSTQAPTFDEVLSLADEALFRAKNTGRDRIIAADELAALVDVDLRIA